MLVALRLPHKLAPILFILSIIWRMAPEHALPLINPVGCAITISNFIIY
jgi:hypothetical protein